MKIPSSIKNPLPRPTECPCCNNQNVTLDDNSILYGRSAGNWPLIWYCSKCQAAVGCHAGTHIPLGKMATRDTRQARRALHHIFDPLWKGRTRVMPRTEAYAWLANQLQIPVAECHMSWFDEGMCNRAIQIIKKSYRGKRR